MSSRLGGTTFVPRWLLGLALALPALRCGGGGDGDAENAGQDTPSAGGASSGTPAAAAPATLTPATAMPATAMPTTATPTAAGDTWSSYAQGFFVSYCVSCHNDDNAGDAARDLHQRSVVDAEAAEIACGLSKSTVDASARGCTGFPPARQFPAGNGAKPSDAERDRLIAWIDAGRP